MRPSRVVTLTEMDSDRPESIARLAFDFYTLRNVSPAELVRRMGYLDAKHGVSAEMIADYLQQHRDWLLFWETYVDDYRASPDWAYRRRDDGRYEVWFFDPQSVNREDRLVFDSHARAAAEYALRHVDGIAARLTVDSDDQAGSSDIRER